MEIKKSVVTSVKYLEGNDYHGQFGTLYKFAVEFENGESGEYSCKDKDNPKFIVDQDQEYQLDLTYPKFPKIKYHNSEYQNKFGGSNKTTTPSNNVTMSKEDWEKKDAETKKMWEEKDKVKYERDDRKQILISRQSSLKGAIDFCRNQDCPIEHVLEQATMFHHWQMTGEVLDVPSVPKEMPF